MPSSAGASGYLRISKLYQTFSVVARTRTPDGYGAWTDAWAATGATFTGVINDARVRELMLAQQLQYSVTHAITAKGAPAASMGSRLALGSLASGATPGPGVRQFQVQNVDNPGELNEFSVYHVEEMR